MFGKNQSTKNHQRFAQKPRISFFLATNKTWRHIGAVSNILKDSLNFVDFPYR